MEMYSNPGIAKSYDYDAVMVGTSMVSNTDVDECEELWGCTMVRLPYSGGTAYNMKTILDVCFAFNDHIKNVYWELDEFQLFCDHTTPRYPLPMYLYRTDRLQDLSYLLNLDIFYHFDVKNLLATVQGKVQPAARTGETLTGTFSREAMLAQYTRPKSVRAAADSDAYIEKVRLNLEYNILPLVESNPDTHFTFFFVPFSILYWDTEMRNGVLDADLDGVEYALEKLLACPNVEVYFYHDRWDIATDLDNYKDTSHYGKWINSWMTRAMADGVGRLTPDNYRDVLDDMRAYIRAYDFDAVFE